MRFLPHALLSSGVRSAASGLPTAPAPALTYADLVIRFRVADAAELKLVEGVCKLALGRRQVCRESRRGDISEGSSPPTARRRRQPSQPVPTEGPIRRGHRGSPPQGRGSAGSQPAPAKIRYRRDETSEHRASCDGAMQGGTAGAAPTPSPQRRHLCTGSQPRAPGRTQRFIAFQAADSPRDLNPIKFLLAVTRADPGSAFRPGPVTPHTQPHTVPGTARPPWT